MQRIAIERRSGLSPAEFAAVYCANGGRPVIVTDEVERWLARSRWTFEYLKETYGSDLAQAYPGLMSSTAKMTKVGEYIDHLDAAERPAGIWLDRTSGKPLINFPEPSETLYLMGWHAFKRHPELFDDILPVPAFADDWVTGLDRATRKRLEAAAEREFWAIYVGPRGSLSQLHQDFGHTHSYLAQIQGRKQATLFAPGDAQFLYDGEVDPEQPDLAKFPLFERATPYHCVIEPGELLFTPPDWWHHVRGLTNSITVSHNFFNASNFGAYLDFIAPLLKEHE